MPGKKPVNSSMPMEDQDRSIRARKNQLFDDSSHEMAAFTKKPFVEYLKTVPGQPLSSAQKLTFWVAGGVVMILFLAAILGGRR